MALPLHVRGAVQAQGNRGRPAVRVLPRVRPHRLPGRPACASAAGHNLPGMDKGRESPGKIGRLRRATLFLRGRGAMRHEAHAQRSCGCSSVREVQCGLLAKPGIGRIGSRGGEKACPGVPWIPLPAMPTWAAAHGPGQVTISLPSLGRHAARRRLPARLPALASRSATGY